MVLRPTSTRPSLYRTLAHPPASSFQTLRPLVPHDPINYHGRTLILPRCTTNRRSPCFAPCGRSSSCTCPSVSAVRSRPWLPSRPVIFLSSFAPHPPTALWTTKSGRVADPDSKLEQDNGPSAHLSCWPLSNTPLSFNYGLYSAIRCQSFIYRVIKAGTPRHRAMSPVTDHCNDHTINRSL